MKSNEYSWHLRKTEISCNISACSTASGGLQTPANTSSKLGPGTLSLQGTYLHVQHSPESHQDPVSNAVLLPEPRGFTSTLPGSHQAAAVGSSALVHLRSLSPARQKDPGTCYPRVATTAELRLCEQTPSAFELLSTSYFGKCPRKKAARLQSCGSTGFNSCASLHGPPRPMSHMESVVQPPLNMWRRQRLENHRVQHGRDA